MVTATMDRALKLAVVTGLRATFGPALLAQAERRPNRHHLALAALGEMAFDKWSMAPSRDTFLPMLARGAAAAWVARSCVKEEGIDDPWAVPLSAAVALGVAVTAPKIRHLIGWTTGLPQPVLGLVEDVLALKLGADAVGLSWGDLTEAARESVGSLPERFPLDALPAQARAWAQSAGAGSI